MGRRSEEGKETRGVSLKLLVDTRVETNILKLLAAVKGDIMRRRLNRTIALKSPINKSKKSSL